MLILRKMSRAILHTWIFNRLSCVEYTGWAVFVYDLKHFWERKKFENKIFKLLINGSTASIDCGMKEYKYGYD